MGNRCGKEAQPCDSAGGRAGGRAGLAACGGRGSERAKRTFILCDGSSRARGDEGGGRAGGLFAAGLGGRRRAAA